MRRYSRGAAPLHTHERLGGERVKRHLPRVESGLTRSRCSHDPAGILILGTPLPGTDRILPRFLTLRDGLTGMQRAPPRDKITFCRRDSQYAVIHVTCVPVHALSLSGPSLT